MNRKIDYHDDPAAPEPNSLVPAVSVVVARDDGAILLIRRTDNENWALPGGAIELNESVRQAAIRETLEETGIDCEINGLAGLYSDPRHVIHYTSNDEVRREFSIVLTARPVAGQPTRARNPARSVGFIRQTWPGTRWTSPCGNGSTTTCATPADQSSPSGKEKRQWAAPSTGTTRRRRSRTAWCPPAASSPPTMRCRSCGNGGAIPAGTSTQLLVPGLPMPR